LWNKAVNGYLSRKTAKGAGEMKKRLVIIFSIIIAVSLIASAIIYFTAASSGEGSLSPGVTLVETPQQDEAGNPPGFPDPEENFIKLPEGVNLAEGKSVETGEVTEVFVPNNAVDGDLTSYWESKGLPMDFTVDLADSYTIQTVAIRLNPAPIWEPRTQTFEVLVSTDGTSYNTVAPSERHQFDPDTGNIVRVDFEPSAARYVRFTFTEKSSGRSNGAQAAEIQVYE